MPTTRRPVRRLMFHAVLGNGSKINVKAYDATDARQLVLGTATGKRHGVKSIHKGGYK